MTAHGRRGRVELPQDWENDVLLYLAGVSWQDVPGSDRRLVEKLADHVCVLWVDPPASRFSRRSDGQSVGTSTMLRPVHRRVAQLTPIGPPGPSRPGIRRISEIHERISIHAALRSLRARAVATVISSALPRSIRWAPRPRLYYATDDFVAGADLMGLSASLLRRSEADKISACDVVAGVTAGLTARLAASGRRAFTLPNGCDTAAYGNVATTCRATDIALPDPIVGVIGQLSDRLDLDVLEAVADGGHSLLLVGPRHAMSDAPRWERLLDRDRVQWVGPRPFAELPAYLAAMTVGITPYADTAFNRASFPLKTLEYLAAGLPVISTDLPAARELSSDLVGIAGDPADFARLVAAALLATPDPALRDARRAFAATHDWSHRAAQVLEALDIPLAVTARG